MRIALLRKISQKKIKKRRFRRRLQELDDGVFALPFAGLKKSSGRAGQNTLQNGRFTPPDRTKLKRNSANRSACR